MRSRARFLKSYRKEFGGCLTLSLTSCYHGSAPTRHPADSRQPGPAFSSTGVGFLPGLILYDFSVLHVKEYRVAHAGQASSHHPVCLAGTTLPHVYRSWGLVAALQSWPTRSMILLGVAELTAVCVSDSPGNPMPMDVMNCIVLPVRA